MSLQLIVDNSVDYSALVSGDELYDSNSKFIEFKEENISETLNLFRIVFEDQLHEKIENAKKLGSMELLLQTFEKKSLKGDKFAELFLKGHKKRDYSCLSEAVSRTYIPSLRKNSIYNNFFETFDSSNHLRLV